MRPARRRWRCQSRLCGPAQSASPEWRASPTLQETPPRHSRRQGRCRRFVGPDCRIESGGECREEAPRSPRPPRRQGSLPQRRVSGSGGHERTHSGRALWSWFPRTQLRRRAGDRSSPDPGDSLRRTTPVGIFGRWASGRRREPAGHRIPARRVHPAALDHGVMDPTAALSMIGNKQGAPPAPSHP